MKMAGFIQCPIYIEHWNGCCDDVVASIENILADIVYPTLYGEADGSHKQILIGANAANGYEPPSVAKVSDSDLILNEILKKRKKK